MHDRVANFAEQTVLEVIVSGGNWGSSTCGVLEAEYDDPSGSPRNSSRRDHPKA